MLAETNAFRSPGDSNYCEKVKIIVPVHIKLGGGKKLFIEFLENHQKYCDVANFILIIQEREFSEWICNQVIKNEFKAVLISNASTNTGVSVGRNIGLESCQSGDWISFLDYDDCLFDTFFVSLETYIRSSWADLVTFPYQINLRDRNNLYKFRKPKFLSYLYCHRFLNFTPCLGTSFVFHGHERFIELDDIQEDYIFWHQILKNSIQFQYSDSVAGVYRPRIMSRSSTNRFSVKKRYKTNTLMGYGFTHFLTTMVFRFCYGLYKYGRIYVSQKADNG